MPPAPISPTGVRRLAAERALFAAAARHDLSIVALRVAGIYGPGRGVHARLRAGTYRVLGAGDGFVSRIHVDDLIMAIARAAFAATPPPIINVADDRPTTVRAHADAVAAIARGLGGLPGEWRLAAVDTEGCDLALGEAVLRLDFAAPAVTPDAVRAELIRAARRARGGAG